MRLIDGDDKPSRRISDALKALEARESELQDQIELEIAKSKATAPPAQAYEALRQEFPIPTISIDNRSRLKELIRSMVERIEVKVSEPGYSIHFKNGQAYGVKLLSRPVPAERI